MTTEDEHATKRRASGEASRPRRTSTGGRADKVLLRDGAAVTLRPAGPDDEGPLLELFLGLSPDSRSARFFGSVSDEVLRREARRQVEGRPDEAFGLVATAGSDDAVIGHASYFTEDGERAEIAFAVADAWQGRGLGTILVGELAAAAADHGIRRLEAVVLPSNHRMVEVFRESGFEPRVRPEPGQIVVEFPADATPGARERYEEREWRAAAAAVEGLLNPRSVAVIGASRRRGTIGGELFHNLLAYGFTGSVFPVNPSAESVQGVHAYSTVEAIPVPVDLAVVAVPAASVLDVVEQCERKGVRRLVVISAGFAEVGGEGVARQEALMRRCRAAGIRLVGPNCMGMANSDDTVRLNATFAPTPPRPGSLAFMSQSGALGLAIMDYSSQLGLGLRTFVSVGNKADVSGNDLIRYWARDPAVEVILLYLESFGNPRKFSKIARRVGRTKPIVAVKSGRSAVGARAAGSHTGALLSTSDTTVDALFRVTGVIRTDTLEELFDVASLLAHQPAPRGRRVAIVSNAGGPGILCADACAAEGLEVPRLADATRSALDGILPPEASVENPVDTIASATPESFRRVVEVVGRDPGVDAVIVIYVPPLAAGAEAMARAIVEAAGTLEAEAKPIVTVFMQSRGLPEGLTGGEVRIPSFAFPESAAIALARVARYGEWLRRPDPEPARFPHARREEAAAVIARALGRGEEWLPPEDVWTVLSCYGLPRVEQRLCASPEEVGEAARAMGGDVAIKAVAVGLVHKTEAGAVELGVEAEAAVEEARDMTDRIRRAGHEPEGFVVQRMAPEGLEMIVGAVHDPQFGPVLACGAGGTLVELLGDVSVRIAPLADLDAREMLSELRTHPVLTGYRGAPRRDEDALVDVILRTSALVDELPQIQELDLNPVLVHEEGVSLVDARIRVGALASAAPRTRPAPAEDLS